MAWVSPQSEGTREASLKSWKFQSNSYVDVSGTPEHIESVARIRRTRNSSSRFSRGLAFFLSAFAKPKIRISPLLHSSNGYLNFSILVLNEGRSAAFDCETVIKSAGPFWVLPPRTQVGELPNLPHQQSADLMDDSSFFLEQWETLNAKSGIPPRVSTDLFPSKKNLSEEQFTYPLIIMFRNPNEFKGVIVRRGKHLSESRTFEQDHDFPYARNPHQRSKDLEVRLEIYFKAKTKDNDTIQESKVFVLTVPNFGKPLECDLSKATSKEVDLERD